MAVEEKGIGNPRALAGLVGALGTYTVSPDAHSVVLRYAEGHKSLDVQTVAVIALGRLRGGPDLVSKSVGALEAVAKKSSRRAVRQAAFLALSALDDTRPFEAVLTLAQPGGDDELRDRAITALGRLGRRDGVRDRTRAQLTAWLDDPDESAQAAAAAGLGELGDPRAVADLERVRSSGRPEEVRSAARLAIEAIRRPEDPKQATAALLERLEAIEKQNRELDAQLKDLLKKFDSLKGQPGKGDGGGKEK